MPSFKKDPDAVLDYTVDWSSWLDTDTIETSTWIAADAAPDQLTPVSDSFTDTKATVWLSGGTAGKTYHMTNRIQTAAGRTDDRTITIKVEQK